MKKKKLTGKNLKLSMKKEINFLKCKVKEELNYSFMNSLI